MSKWRIQAFQGASAIGLDRVISGGENQIRTLLERLAARHLTDEEIIDATFGSRSDLEIRKDARPGYYSLETVGTDYHYAAKIEDE